MIGRQRQILEQLVAARAIADRHVDADQLGTYRRRRGRHVERQQPALAGPLAVADALHSRAESQRRRAGRIGQAQTAAHRQRAARVDQQAVERVERERQRRRRKTHGDAELVTPYAFVAGDEIETGRESAAQSADRAGIGKCAGTRMHDADDPRQPTALLEIAGDGVRQQSRPFETTKVMHVLVETAYRHRLTAPQRSRDVADHAVARRPGLVDHRNARRATRRDADEGADIHALRIQRRYAHVG